jgi:lipid-A-disaccharide synthase
VALAASGTATLEAALAGVPAVVVYRVSRTTYALVRPVYRLNHVCIVNILAGGSVVPELLQNDVRPDVIAGHARRLMQEGPERSETLAALRRVVEALGQHCPSRRVAEILRDHLEGRG